MSSFDAISRNYFDTLFMFTKNYFLYVYSDGSALCVHTRTFARYRIKNRVDNARTRLSPKHTHIYGHTHGHVIHASTYRRARARLDSQWGRADRAPQGRVVRIGS